MSVSCNTIFSFSGLEWQGILSDWACRRAEGVCQSQLALCQHAVQCRLWLSAPDVDTAGCLCGCRCSLDVSMSTDAVCCCCCPRCPCCCYC